MDTDLLEALDQLARGQTRTESNEALLKKFFAEPNEMPDDQGVPNAKEVAVDVAIPTDDKANLLRYLSRTRDYVDQVDSLLPFLYLGQDQIDRRLGSGEARRVKDMLANAQVDALREHVKAIAARSDAGSEQDIDALVELFGELLSSLTGLELANAQNTICQVFGELPARLRGSLADRIGKFAEEQTVQLSVGDAITIASAATDEGSRETLLSRVLLGSEDVSDLNASAIVVYERVEELTSAGYPRVAIDDFVSGAITGAAKAASLPLLHSWLQLVPAPGSSEAMPTATQGLLALSYLQAAVAQPSDSPNLDGADVHTIGRLFQADEASRGTYGDQATKIINAHGLGESFGRLALSAATAAGELTNQRAANLVAAISRKALVEAGTIDTTIEPGSVRNLVGLLVRWCPPAKTFTTKLGDEEKVPVLTAVVPVCAAIISEATQLTALASKQSDDSQLTIDEVRDLGRDLFAVLAANQPDAVEPCVNALTAQWQARRGVEADAYLWTEPTLSVIDTVDPSIGDPAIAGIVDGVVGRTRSDAIATSSLPVVEKALSTAAGVRAVPSLVVNLRGQLTAGNPDVALFALDVIGLVYKTARDPAAGDAPNVLSALNTLIAPRTAPMLSEALHCLIGTDWPTLDLPTAVNTASQYCGDLNDADLDYFLSALKRAREGGVGISELSNEMANRLIERVLVSGDAEPALVTSLWQVSGPPARARIATAVSGVTEAEKATLEGNAPDRPAEIDRWVREIVGGVAAGTSTAGAQGSMSVVQQYPEEAYLAISTLTNEWLGGTASMPDAAWPLLFSALSPVGMTQQGQRLYSSLGEGRDQLLRALPLLAAWVQSASEDVFASVINAEAFGEVVRAWVLDHRDVEVSQAIRPLLDASPRDFRRGVKDRVGRRPRGDARPAWEAVFGDSDD